MFKKFIILSSFGLIVAFSIALANANDSDSQQADQSSSMTTTRQSTVHESSTCTDKNGVILQKTDKAYQTCVQHMKKSQGEMGGQANSNGNPPPSPNSMNSDSGSNPPSSSDSNQ